MRIQDAALVAAATLSNRYITDRFLPDKAIDLVDEAASRVRVQIDSMPEELDQLERKRMQLEIEREALEEGERRRERAPARARRARRSPSCAKTCGGAEGALGEREERDRAHARAQGAVARS